ncbi:MAG: helix-turn-helix domain-containing protein [Lachnospiraceae bacterium]|nr:helix-turn-helix domain-containing protein [Lachnospiraceae bacterium]
MDDLLKQMGTSIHDRRKQLRLTQEELAERADITPQTVSTAELGKKALRPENIIRICSALEISTDYLLLGIVTNEDRVLMSEKLSQLSPREYRYLEDIVNSYVAVLKNPEDEGGWKKLFPD